MWYKGMVPASVSAARNLQHPWINAEQWALISLYSVNTRGYKVEFHGVLTQWQACQQASASQCYQVDNLPATGWLQLYNELSRDARTYYSLVGYRICYGVIVLPLISTSPKGPEPVQAQPQASLPQQTVDFLQKALQDPAVDTQMKDSLQEKITNAKRILSDTEIGLANPAVKDPAWLQPHRMSVIPVSRSGYLTDPVG